MMMLLWKKGENKKSRGRMPEHAPATGVVKRGKVENPKKPEGKRKPEPPGGKSAPNAQFFVIARSCGRQFTTWQSMKRFSNPKRWNRPRGRLDCHGPSALAMTKAWRVTGKIAVRRVAVRRTGYAAFAMTRWGVIARTRGNAPAIGTVKRRKVEKPENPEGKRKPEEEGKAGEEERRKLALS
ncbi:MAG: hypothetical protein LBO79_04505 [Zoogloeaceae bacterium]|nr:hypothetical protein [Zoogloeaceae bacterium]